jgi:hypothetical protein
MPAFTVIMVRLWATMSWSSLAMRRRSSVRACSACSSAVFRAYSLLTLVVQPSAQVVTMSIHTNAMMPRSSGHGSVMATHTAIRAMPPSSAGVDRRLGRATATRYRANRVGVYTSNVMWRRVAAFWETATTA